MVSLVTTVVGIIVLVVLCDIILPEGQTTKYIRLVANFIIISVMLTAIINAIATIEVLDINTTGKQYILDTDYLAYVGEETSIANAYMCEATLEVNGYYNADVNIVSDSGSSGYNIDSIVVNINKSDISSKYSNIDIVVQDIVTTLSQLMNVEHRQVKVCLR